MYIVLYYYFLIFIDSFQNKFPLDAMIVYNGVDLINGKIIHAAEMELRENMCKHIHKAYIFI